MSEEPISITNLNDFIFCPASIYFHSLERDTEKSLYQDEYQINGTAVHEKIDKAEYSDKKSILQAVSVYSEQFNIYGKIDVFDINKGILTERKKKITTIYDGYVFQLYSQYFALTEMGYTVNKIRLHSIDDNKTYWIDFPANNSVMYTKFCKTINEINRFNLSDFVQTNISKCKHCVYEPLCSFSLLKE